MTTSAADGKAAAADNGRQSTSSTTSSSPAELHRKSEPRSRGQKAVEILFWMPAWCRWKEGQPPKFSIWMNILFAFAGSFTVANLYYNHPILDILSRDFNVSYYQASTVPTLMQSGYAVGLFFICPMGDLLKRRPFTLSLVFVSATLWIGLCITKSFVAFQTISFLVAVTTVTPQIMLPLVGDLAPVHRRATALAICASGFILGILIARILSGIVTQYTTWRNVYWLALGLQYAIFILLWLVMPDYPRTNDGMNYFKALWSMIQMCKKHSVLMQAGLISFATSASFTSFWTTLTFLLASPPYQYSTLVIGLFALIGIAAIVLTPVYGRTFIDRFVPAVSVYIGLATSLIGVCIGTYIGTFSVAGPIIQALLLDAGMQITQTANRSAIFAVEPKGRNRINTVFMVMTFLGQITGTAAGNQVYEQHGWVASGSLSVALLGFAVFVNTVRGPYERGWIGWSGGWSIMKRNKLSADGMTAEKPSGLAQVKEEKRHPQQTDVEKGSDGEQPTSSNER